jgi:hypothetical protein
MNTAFDLLMLGHFAVDQIIVDYLTRRLSASPAEACRWAGL